MSVGVAANSCRAKEDYTLVAACASVSLVRLVMHVRRAVPEP
jgi:hypothetical protein